MQLNQAIASSDKKLGTKTVLNICTPYTVLSLHYTILYSMTLFCEEPVCVLSEAI